MNVYPAAGLIDFVRAGVPVYLIDPNDIEVPVHRKIEIIKDKASVGIQILKNKLLQDTETE